MVPTRCIYCGNMIQPGQRFCPYCGKEVPSQPYNQMNQAPPMGQMNQPPMGAPMGQQMPMGQMGQQMPYRHVTPIPPKKKSKGWLVLLIILLILAALAGGGYAVYKYYIKPKYEEAIEKTKSFLDEEDDDVDSFSTSRDDRDYSTEQQNQQVKPEKKNKDIPQGLNNEPFGMTDEEAAQLSRAQREEALRKAQQARREAERKLRAQQRKAQRQQQQYYDEPFGMTDEEAAQLTPAQRRALARRAAQIRRRNGQR